MAIHNTQVNLQKYYTKLKFQKYFNIFFRYYTIYLKTGFTFPSWCFYLSFVHSLLFKSRLNKVSTSFNQRYFFALLLIQDFGVRIMNANQVFKNVSITLCVLLLTACSKQFNTGGREDLKELSVKGDPDKAGKVNFPVSCGCNSKWELAKANIARQVGFFSV